MDRVPITKEGYEALKNDLEYLKKVERPKNLKAIEEALSHGDLSENAEFEAAKNRQAFVDAKLNELEYKLSRAEIIDAETLPKDRVVFASFVVLENIETGEHVEYQLVGPDESDIENGRISVSSPLGKAMIGKKPGDEITFQVPGGTRSFELIDIL
ncbi:MAG: transcription elongation factor GreA [Desulfobacterales bacterium]|nr:MAG: transcription elongation factor GreA [Desulfobacterales bacterium]